MSYNRKEHGDFKSWYDTKLKRNYWTLGYFGGGAVNIVEARDLAIEFSEVIGVPLETVYIDEILTSRRYKGFKFLFSTVEKQKPDKDAYKTEDVMKWLHD